MSTSFGAHLLFLISLFIRPDALLAACTGAVLLADFLLLHRSAKNIGRLDLLSCFVPWEGFYFLYTVLFAPTLLLPTTVKWKEISYSWKMNWQLKKVNEET